MHLELSEADYKKLTKTFFDKLPPQSALVRFHYIGTSARASKMDAFRIQAQFLIFI